MLTLSLLSGCIVASKKNKSSASDVGVDATAALDGGEADTSVLADVTSPPNDDVNSATDLLPTEDGAPSQDAVTPDDVSIHDASLDDSLPSDVTTEVDTPMDTAQPDTLPEPDTAPPPDPCANVTCPAVGTCVNGTCVCDDGYESDGNNGCNDVDECAQGNTGCDAMAGCINLDGSYTCGACPPAYDDVNGNGTLCSLNYNACGLGRFSTKATGTQNDPLVAPYLPMVDHNSTASSPSDKVDTYDCAPGKLETGPEIFYRFVTEHPGAFHAELTDAQGVDIDIHLVQNPTMNGSQMTGCIARAHEKLTVENLPAGEYWVVADTWSDGATEYQGAYSLAFEWTAVGVWNEVPIDEGITWSRLRLMLPDSDQTINKVRIDMNQGWDVQPEEHPGCKTVASVQENLGALVGINGTFYNGSCNSLGLLRADGVTYSTNTMTGYEQRTIGWNAGETPTLKWLQPNEDWTEVSDAIGGYPSLVTDGVGIAEAVPGSQVWSAVDWQNHPRSIVAIDAAGHLVLMTFDGRTAAGDGITNPALATYLANEGYVQAMNLDGGGSTTMTVHDCWLNHVVSYPSDNKTPDHFGGRSVGNGLYVR